MITLLGPEIFICILIAVLFVFTLCSEPFQSTWASRITILFLGLAAISSVLTLNENASHFWGAYTIDGLSQSFKGIISGLLLLILTLSGRPHGIPHTKGVEFRIFLSSAALGLMMLTSAAEILTFYIGLELAAYSTYVLVPIKAGPRNAEAGIKYIIFGAAMSGLLLYGISLIMGLTQTTLFQEMIPASEALAHEPVFLLSLFLIGTALFFKLSLYPFHFWAPDVYEAAPTPVVTYIATASKAAATVIVLRIFWYLGIPENIAVILGIMAFLSMTVGNFTAILQSDLKRLMAYSSIAQAGYLLVAILSHSIDAFSAVFFYAAVYTLMNLGVFLVILRLGEEHHTDNPRLDHLNGLADRSPLLAALLLVCVLSLAGIPPLAGFTGKWFLFAAAMKEGHAFLVLWGVINSVISLFYYLTLVKHAYLIKAEDKPLLAINLRYKIISYAILMALVFYGVFPRGLINFATQVFS